MSFTDKQSLACWFAMVEHKPARMKADRVNEQLELVGISHLLDSGCNVTVDDFRERICYEDGSTVPMLTDEEFRWLFPGLLIHAISSMNPSIARSVVERLLQTPHVVNIPNCKAIDDLIAWLEDATLKCVELGWTDDKRVHVRSHRVREILGGIEQ